MSYTQGLQNRDIWIMFPSFRENQVISRNVKSWILWWNLENYSPFWLALTRSMLTQAVQSTFCAAVLEVELTTIWTTSRMCQSSHTGCWIGWKRPSRLGINIIGKVIVSDVHRGKAKVQNLKLIKNTNELDHNELCQ